MKRFLSFLLLFVGISNLAFSFQTLLPLQGNVYDSSGNPIISGDLRVLIYDAPTGGNLLYDSVSDFQNAIENSQYDVLLGSGSNNLTLEYGEYYYIEILINGEDIDFNGDERQLFQSSVGNIRKTSSYGDTFLDDYSFSSGYQSNASGYQSNALGFMAKATGTRAVSLGHNNLASGFFSFAAGESTISNGSTSTTFGSQTMASGDYSFAAGNGAQALGDYSFAFGQPSTIAKKLNSVAIGNSNKALGNSSLALGTNSFARGVHSIAIGSSQANANGDSSIALGTWINVNGKRSVGISLDYSGSWYDINQSNTFAVMGGNSGFNISEPKRVVHIDQAMRLEPTYNIPSNPSLGDIYVNNFSEELCFFNGNNWKGISEKNCENKALEIVQISTTDTSEGFVNGSGIDEVQIIVRLKDQSHQIDLENLSIQLKTPFGFQEVRYKSGLSSSTSKHYNITYSSNGGLPLTPGYIVAGDLATLTFKNQFEFGEGEIQEFTLRNSGILDSKETKTPSAMIEVRTYLYP